MVLVSRSHFTLEDQILNAPNLIIQILALNKLVLEKRQELLGIVEHTQIIGGHAITSVCQTLLNMLESRKQLGKKSAQWKVWKGRFTTGQ